MPVYHCAVLDVVVVFRVCFLLVCGIKPGVMTLDRNDDRKFRTITQKCARFADGWYFFSKHGFILTIGDP